MPKKEFDVLKQGVRFECQGSGKCCLSHGRYGYVFLNLSDRRRMARFFGLATGQFTRRYCKKNEDGQFHLKSDDERDDCLFLENKRCTVYEARPGQCRTWPFWPEVMNAKTWRRDVQSFCPGVGKGRLYSAEEIRAILNEQLAADRNP